MILKGIITSIDSPRQFTTRDGQEMTSYQVKIHMPYVTAQGEERSDNLTLDHIIGNSKYLEQLKDLMAKQTKCEFVIHSEVRNWNNRDFNNIRLSDVKPTLG